MAALVVTTGFTSCSEDDLDTNQYNKSGVNILGFGPMPITRGETMRLTGPPHSLRVISRFRTPRR